MSNKAAYSDLKVYGALTSETITIDGEYTLPTADGSPGFILTTDGAGNTVFADPASIEVLTTISILDGTGISWTVLGANTVRGDVSLAPFSTTNLAEGVNLYFTNERVDDRVSALIQNGTGISWAYNDGANTLTPTISLAAFDTDDLSEGVTNLYYDDQYVSDFIGNTLINPGITGSDPTNPITWVYVGGGVNTLTPIVSLGPFDTDDLSEGSTNKYYDNELVADFLGNVLLQDTATITWTYNDIANTLEANFVGATGSIEILEEGSLVATRGKINFIAGPGITIDISDNVGSSRADVTITSDLESMSIEDLSDVDFTSPGPQLNDVLVFNGVSWESAQISSFFVDQNIYEIDGTLTSNRTLNMDGNNLNIYDGDATHVGGGKIALGAHRIPQTAACNTASGAGTGQVNVFLDISHGYLNAIGGSQIRFFRDSSTLENGRLWHNSFGDGSLRIQNDGDIWITPSDTNGLSNIILDAYVFNGSAVYRLPGVSQGSDGVVLSTAPLTIGTPFTSAALNNNISQKAVRGLSISYEESGGVFRTAVSSEDSVSSPILFYDTVAVAGGDPGGTGGFVFALGEDPLDAGAAADIQFLIKQGGLIRAHGYGSGTFVDADPAYFLGVDSDGRHVEVAKSTVKQLGTGGIYSQIADTADIVNTTTETTLLNTASSVGSVTVGANQFSVGDSFRLIMKGIITSNNGVTLDVDLTPGTASTVTLSITLPSLSSRIWEYEAIFTIRALGAAGVAEIIMTADFGFTRTDGSSYEYYTSRVRDNTNFDTTASNTLDITAQWSAADPGNSIGTYTAILEKIY